MTGNADKSVSFSGKFQTTAQKNQTKKDVSQNHMRKMVHLNKCFNATYYYYVLSSLRWQQY